MHNSVDSINVVSQHETCHGVGWKRESLIRAIQAPWKPIAHFVSTFCWLYYAILCWRSTGRINRHCTMVYHLWRPPRSQCFENPLKTIVGLCWFTIRGLFFFHWRSAGIPRIIYPQGPGATAASATQQSHKDLGVFSWCRHDCGAYGNEYGDAPGIVQARKSDVPESTKGTVWKNVWSTNPPWRSMVRAMGIPINDGTTIPLHEKTFHVLTIAHITTNNSKTSNC